MKKIVRTALAASISLALAACGSDSNNNDDPIVDPDPVTPSSLALSGSGIKGALSGAKVQIYRASDTGFTTPFTTEPADIQTDENGNYTGSIVDATGDAILGALVVNVTADDDTQMRCDAAITCGETLRGELIPTSEVANLSLTTLTVATVDENGEGVPALADVNTLTSLATDAVLAQVAANTNIDIDNLAPAGVTALQQNASSVVGEILGVDLSTTNIYDIMIVDSTDTQGVADAATEAGDAASITNTLTLVNASLAAVTGEEGSTIADNINSYVQTVAVVSATVVDAVAAGTDIATALASPEAQAAQDELAVSQQEISDQADLITVAVEQDIVDTGVDIILVTEPIPVVVEPITEIVIIDVPLDPISGATGG